METTHGYCRARYFLNIHFICELPFKITWTNQQYNNQITNLYTYRQKALDPLVRNRRGPPRRCSASHRSTRSRWKCTCDAATRTPGTRYSGSSPSSPAAIHGEHCSPSVRDTRRPFAAASSNSSRRNLQHNPELNRTWYNGIVESFDGIPMALSIMLFLWKMFAN